MLVRVARMEEEMQHKLQVAIVKFVTANCVCDTTIKFDPHLPELSISLPQIVSTFYHCANLIRISLQHLPIFCSDARRHWYARNGRAHRIPPSV